LKRRVQLMIDSKLYIHVKSIAGSLDISYSAFAELALKEKIEMIERKINLEKKQKL